MCKGNKIKDGDEVTEGPVLIKEVLDLDKYNGLQVSGVPNRVSRSYKNNFLYDCFSRPLINAIIRRVRYSGVKHIPPAEKGKGAGMS